MATILLVIIYITFIGLGIPDSLFGTAWPAIYTELHLPVSYANFVTSIISGGTILSSLLSAKVISRFGTAKVTAVSTALTACALFGFSSANHVLFLCLFAIPLGIGAGAIDTALNNYVALHYKAVHMNFLHCFYGIGVSLSPYLMSLMLSDNGNWRNGYRTVFFVQSGIAAVSILTVPLWKTVRDTLPQGEETISETGFFYLLKQCKVRRACLILIGSCAIEYTCGIWGSTFLVNQKGMAVDFAAKMITLYYIGMACGRFLSGVVSYKFNSWQILKAGQGTMLIAIVLLVLPFPALISGFALFLVGLGNAPIFPNMLHLTPSNFGKEISQTVMSIQMSASYLSILLAPVIFGWIAQNISVALFPFYLCILYVMIPGSKGQEIRCKLACKRIFELGTRKNTEK